MLSFIQFKVLEALAGDAQGLSKETLWPMLKASADTVNRTLYELSTLHLISDNQITPLGLDALEPYRVKRAVFIAAGFGSRMVPITLQTPKPLVRVKGRMLIDTLLSAVVAAGILEIYVVRGYLGEQFDPLLKKYPMIQFIENPRYNEGNNILSVACAGDKLQNAYVLEADLYLSNPALITTYQYASNYLAIPVEKTDDWCFISEDGIIKEVAIGGVDCDQMVGISYWTQADGERLAGHVQKVINTPGGKDRYWDHVPLLYYQSDYKVGIRPCTCNDIVEIDTFEELVQLDPAYRAQTAK